MRAAPRAGTKGSGVGALSASQCPTGASPATGLGGAGPRLARLTVAMLRYRVAILVWTFMLLGASASGGPQLAARGLLLAGAALGWSYVAATTVNDLADVEIDLVNHPQDRARPLVSGLALPSDMRKLHWVAWAGAAACAASLGLVPTGLVLAGLVIGRAYSLPPARLSYRPYLAPTTLAVAYVVIPYALGLVSEHREVGTGVLLVGAALVPLFLARIVLKDFRDREGDAIFGRRSILVLHGKAKTCAVSGAGLLVGDALLCLGLGEQAWPALVVAQGFFLSIGAMLWRLWKAEAGPAEQVAIGTGAKMGNGLLLCLLSWLLLTQQGAPLGARAAFLIFLAGLYSVSFVTLARHPERAVIGSKG